MPGHSFDSSRNFPCPFASVEVVPPGRVFKASNGPQVRGVFPSFKWVSPQHEDASPVLLGLARLSPSALIAKPLVRFCAAVPAFAAYGHLAFFKSRHDETVTMRVAWAWNEVVHQTSASLVPSSLYRAVIRLRSALWAVEPFGNGYPKMPLRVI